METCATSHQVWIQHAECTARTFGSSRLGTRWRIHLGLYPSRQSAWCSHSRSSISNGEFDVFLVPLRSLASFLGLSFGSLFPLIQSLQPSKPPVVGSQWLGQPRSAERSPVRWSLLMPGWRAKDGDEEEDSPSIFYKTKRYSSLRILINVFC